MPLFHICSRTHCALSGKYSLKKSSLMLSQRKKIWHMKTLLLTKDWQKTSSYQMFTCTIPSKKETYYCPNVITSVLRDCALSFVDQFYTIQLCIGFLNLSTNEEFPNHCVQYAMNWPVLELSNTQIHTKGWHADAASSVQFKVFYTRNMILLKWNDYSWFQYLDIHNVHTAC